MKSQISPAHAHGLSGSSFSQIYLGLYHSTNRLLGGQTLLNRHTVTRIFMDLSSTLKLHTCSQGRKVF